MRPNPRNQQAKADWQLCCKSNRLRTIQTSRLITDEDFLDFLIGLKKRRCDCHFGLSASLSRALQSPWGRTVEIATQGPSSMQSFGITLKQIRSVRLASSNFLTKRFTAFERVL